MGLTSNNFTYMKKNLISGLILGSVLFPSLSMAQTVDTSPATSAQIDDIKNTLIALLTQMIASLQAQINQIIAQQSPQAVTAPSTNSIGGADTVAQNPFTISLGAITCPQPGTEGYDSEIEIPIVSTSQWNKLDFSFDDYQRIVVNGSLVIAGRPPMVTRVQTKRSYPSKYQDIYLENVPGDYHISGTAYDVNGNNLGSFSQTVTVGTECPSSGVLYSAN